MGNDINNGRSCEPVALDFNELSAGSYIRDELWETRGVRITAKKWRDSDSNGFTPDVNGNHSPEGGAARVFDTSNPVCDDDLGAPHKDFNGPGKGCGGGEFLMKKTNKKCEYVYDKMGNRQDNPWKNDKPLGNVLIIQETNKDCADDSQQGGTITFDFKQPATVNLAKLLDVDESENTPDIVLTYSKIGSDEKTINVDATGDNGVWSKQLNENDVIKIEVKFWGSGSIAELNYYDFINCNDEIKEPKEPTAAPTTMTPTNLPTKVEATKSPTVSPTIVPIVTEAPTGSLNENSLDDDDGSDDTFLPPLYCPEDIKVVRKLGMTDYPTENTPAVEIVSQDTSTVTVALKQEWSTAQKVIDSIFYEYNDSMWDRKCYEENDVAGGDSYDTITITCNILSPLAYLEICVIDELSNGILSVEDNGILPKCCHSDNEEFPNENPVVCYLVEIRCTSICIEEQATGRNLRGSKK